MTMHIDTILVSPLQQNCRVLHMGQGSPCLIVDPGADADRIVAHIQERDLQPEAIWLTHSHLDHCGGVSDLLEAVPMPLLGSAVEKEMRARVAEVATLYGIPAGLMKDCPEPSRYITDGETLDFAGVSFSVLSTPGHSPGHLCMYAESEHVLLAGDTVFAGSIGRSDLPGGDHATLMHSIQTKILSLPDQTRILSGHGPDTTVGQERVSNPWLQE